MNATAASCNAMRRIDIDSDDERLRIEFPYDESLVATVRSLPNREYDPDSKHWFVPFAHVDRVFDVLLDRHFTITESLREFCRDRGRPVDQILDDEAGGATEGPIPVPPDTLAISELNREAEEVMRQHFDESIWVVGEMQDYDGNRNYKHAFFELVERPAEDADPIARIQTVMFEDVWRRVEESLEEAPEEIRLRDGLSVRMKGEVEIYPQKGSYQFVVEEVDPTYTTGKIQQNRQRVLQHLEELGIREQNRELPWPICPVRVGLITSHGSDAHRDFADELRASGFGFDLTVVDARVQGERTEESVLGALEWFRRRADSYDVVAFVRGGGARSDLAYFDTEAIGEAVCEHPVKLICGIGHEQDVSLLDHVCESTKTPTAAGRQLVDRVGAYRDRLEEGIEGVLEGAREALRDAEARLERVSAEIGHRSEQKLAREQRRLSDLRNRVSHAARDRLEEGRRRLNRLADRLPRESRDAVERERRRVAWAARRLDGERLERRFDRERESLADRVGTLVRRVERAIEGERDRVDRLAERLELLDPQKVLERGFAVAWSQGEEVRRAVRSNDEVEDGDLLDLEVADGTIQVEVEFDEPD